LNPEEIIDHLVKRFSAKYDLTKARDKSAFVKKLGPYIKATRDEILKNEYIKRISTITEINEELIQKAIESSEAVDVDFARKITGRAPENEDAASRTSAKISKKEFLGAILVQDPEMVSKAVNISYLFEKWFVEFLNALESGTKIASLLTSLSSDKKDLIKKLAMIEVNIQDRNERVKIVGKLCNDIYSAKLKDQIETLERKIKKAEEMNQEYGDMLNQVAEKSRKLKKLARRP
jgi:DNA primase